MPGSSSGLRWRFRRLYRHGYLERPQSQRPTKALTDEIVYSLGNQGARLLQESYSLPIGHLDWDETPKKQRGFPYIEHQLGVARVMTAIRIACHRPGVEIQWDGHFDRRRHRLQIPGKKTRREADAYFSLEIPGKGQARHFLELDRGRNLNKMTEKYEDYLLAWKEARNRPPYTRFRVLTVTTDESQMESLRRVARGIGNTDWYQGAWKGLMFSHVQAFDLENAHKVTEDWRYPDGNERVSLFT